MRISDWSSDVCSTDLAAGNIFDRRTACYERGKGLGFVGRVHGQAVEVLRKAGLDRGFSTVLEHEAGDFVIAGEDIVVSERNPRAAATLPGFDVELDTAGRPEVAILRQSVDTGGTLQ